MKSIAKLLLLAAALVAALFTTQARAEVQAGKAAPDFSFTDLNGKTHKLSDFRGKPVVLEWVNSGCPVVKRHYNTGNMQSTQQDAAAHGAVWIQINSGHPGAQGDLDNAKALEWQKKQGVVATAYTRDHAGKIGRLYGAKTTPHMYVIDAQGTLVYHGAIDDNPGADDAAETKAAKNYVKAALGALKAGKPVEKSSSKAYGCGIKYGRVDA